MTDTSFPHLGWNPAPGSPAEIAALRSKLTASASALGTAYRLVDQLLNESSYWKGDAADAFRAALTGDLPRYLRNAHRSLTKAAGRLGSWHDDLVAYQATARGYEARAGVHAKALRAAESAHSSTTARADASAAEVTSAATALTRAREALSDVRRLARELEETHRAEASRIAKALDEATDRLAPKEPGLLDRALGWVDRNLGDGLSALSALAGLIAVFATGTALVPLLFVAAGLSLAALVTHASDPKIQKALAAGFTEGKFDAKFWSAAVTLGGDALGSLPGVGAVAKGAKGAVAAARQGTAAGRGVSASARDAAQVMRTDSAAAMQHINDAPKPLVEWAARHTRPTAARPITAGLAGTGLAAAGMDLTPAGDDETAKGTATAVDGARLAGAEAPNAVSAARAWARFTP
ncbi:hypothetical protein [Streptomyces sp. NRRL S-118]|uniref:hypothetical protein n=1 Tax=Streptomyces sp. NRRL S-118 TaxID=1463881 RepID=UPI0006950B37|nr:hypothetical protein [Streptomyces sp. NRRL S-118]